MIFHSPRESDLSLQKKDFKTLEFLIYRGFRLLLLPLGRTLSMHIAIRLHWIFRHLAMAVSSNKFGVDFLNSRSAIVQGGFLEKYVLEGNSVVDVACGTARYWPAISLINGVTYLGIDSSRLHISTNVKTHPEAQFILANALDDGVIPKSDVIIASHFLEHLDHPDAFLVRVRQLCGKLIIEVPDFFSDPINTVALLSNAPWWTDRDHRREYSERNLEALLFKCGYAVVDKKISGGTLAVVACSLP